ncbi:MAG: hypothetical protein HC945_03025 [Nitrosarchaeum sp.]|nr:hypothetical protein [Nitrosarchaeum sp.]
MEHIRTLRQAGGLDPQLIGAKVYDLLLLSEHHMNVPVGFVVLNTALQAFVDENDLRPKIISLLSNIAWDRDQDLERAYASIRELFVRSRLPARILAEVLEGVDSLVMDDDASLHEMMSEDHEPNVVLMLSTENALLPDSNEGVVQNVMGKEELEIALKECWASAFTASMLRSQRLRRVPNAGVFVYRMQPAKASGIATCWAGGEHIDVQTYFGHLDLEGRVKGDRFLVSREFLTIEKSMYGRQPVKLVVSGHHFERVSLGIHGEQQKVNDKQVMELARLAKRSSQLLGSGTRVLCSFKAEDPLILQVQRVSGDAPADQDLFSSAVGAASAGGEVQIPEERVSGADLDLAAEQEGQAVSGNLPLDEGASGDAPDEHGIEGRITDEEHNLLEHAQRQEQTMRDSNDAARPGAEGQGRDVPEVPRNEAAEDSFFDPEDEQAYLDAEEVLEAAERTSSGSPASLAGLGPVPSGKLAMREAAAGRSAFPLGDAGVTNDPASAVEDESFGVEIEEAPQVIIDDEADQGVLPEQERDEALPEASVTWEADASAEDLGNGKDADDDFFELDDGEEDLEGKDRTGEGAQDVVPQRDVGDGPDSYEDDLSGNEPQEALHSGGERRAEEAVREQDEGDALEDVSDEEERSEFSVQEHSPVPSEGQDDVGLGEQAALSSSGDLAAHEPEEVVDLPPPPDDFILGAKVEEHNPEVEAKKGLQKLMRTLESMLRRHVELREGQAPAAFFDLVDRSGLDDARKQDVRDARLLVSQTEKGEAAPLDEYVEAMRKCSDVLSLLI